MSSNLQSRGFMRLNVFLALQFAAGFSTAVLAQAPALNPVQMHKGRVLNEVHLQLVPDAYVVPLGDGNQYGVQVYSIAPMTNGTVSETAQMGDRYSDRRLTGAWSGSFGSFRMTRVPDASAPFNQHGGILMTPPKDTNQLRVHTRNLKDFNGALPDTRFTLYANGVTQGAVTVSTPSGSGYPVDLPLNLNGAETFSMKLTGPGSATVNEVYLYHASSPAAPLSWGTTPATAIGGGAAVKFGPAFYGGPANDMALRVQATGVNAASRLVVSTQSGKIILEAPLTAGANLLTTADPDPQRRAADATRSYPVGTTPPPSESRVIWGDDMKLVGLSWTKLSAAASLYTTGNSVVIEGPASAGTVAARIALPRAISLDEFQYLSMRMRADDKCSYFIRPYLGTTPAHTKSFVTALEARPGEHNGGKPGWEKATFNLKTLADLYSTPARSVDSFDLIVGPRHNSRPTLLRLEIDYMAFSKGVQADTVLAKEQNFADGIDDDGDGLVDRDDPDFREQFPTSVYVNYQTVVRKLGLPGFSGARAPAPGQAGPTYNVDAFKFSPNNATKRQIASTYYPLDYVTNPTYEPPGNYNEYWDKNTSGNWAPCGSTFSPPTEQFPSLNYQALGAIEEYDVTNPTWMGHQADLARRYGLDGFIYNDFGYSSDEPHIDGMKHVLNGRNAGAWNSNPFKLAPFYSTLGDPNSTVQTAASAVKDLLYSMKQRGMQLAAGITFRGKPIIFVYPTSAGSGLGSTLDNQEWGQIFEGMRRPDAENFDGAFNAPAAVPNAENVLSIKFNRWRTTGDRQPWGGSLDRIEWLNTNMVKVGETQVGKPEQRSALLDGWWIADTPASGAGGIDAYTEMIQYQPGDTPGQARLKTTIPSNAVYMRMVMRAWGNGPEVGGLQQTCELRINSPTSGAGVTFNAKAGFNNYLLRLRTLPAGFSSAGQTVQTLPELPVSFWGNMPGLVARTDQGYNRPSGFDGLADYNSIFKDARVEVSYPHLRAATLRPGLDHGGYLYSCGGLNHYYSPYNKGATYRSEWEEAIRTGADMVIITSWNEFAEGTNLEPDIERGFGPLRLTQTYSLMYKGKLQTGKMPTVTGLLVKRYDIQGAQRTIDFSLTGPDTIRFKNTGFGPSASGIVSILRNGSPVALGSSGATWEGVANNPTLVINAPAGASQYTIVYNYTAPPNCTYALSATSTNVVAAGATGSFSVTAGGGCSWTAVSNSSWLTVTSGASGSGNGVVNFSAASNGTSTGRTGLITVAGFTYRVTQNGGVATCTYSISSASATIPAAGGSGSFTVTAGAGCGWTGVSNAAWLAITSGASGNGGGTVSYSASPNSAAVGRVGTITAAGKVHTVTQEGAGPRGHTILNPTQKLTVRSAGTGFQEMYYNYTTGETSTSPYQAFTAQVPYTLPFGQWVGIYHYDYATERFSQALYSSKDGL